jgi:response regulator RpfG family c-di-GMP phosphodiesterase
MAVVVNAKEKKEQIKALKDSQERALKSMMTIINIHDKETGEHIIRTKEYTKVMATYLYRNKIYPHIVTPIFIEHLYRAAPLHDIGKIGIPDVILKKPGKLTRTEFEVMKEHATLGKEIIQNFITQHNKESFFTILHDVVYAHHERWDGEGYPNKLKADEIPLSAQIMALCDVYDALVSKRRYKDSFSYERADAIIIESRGTIFNPILVDAFLEVRMEFHDIADRWKDKEEKPVPHIEKRDTIKSYVTVQPL